MLPTRELSTKTSSRVPTARFTWSTRISSSVRLLCISYWPKPFGTAPFSVGPMRTANRSPAFPGEGDGLGEPLGLGLTVGLADGETVGEGDAFGVPVADGEAVGLADGEGETVGEGDAFGVPVAEGDAVGLPVGDAVGLTEGDGDGDPVGLPVGDAVGVPVGDPVGLPVGEPVGLTDGDGLGGGLEPKTPFTRMFPPFRTSQVEPIFTMGTAWPSCVLKRKRASPLPSTKKLPIAALSTNAVN